MKKMKVDGRGYRGDVDEEIVTTMTTTTTAKEEEKLKEIEAHARKKIVLGKFWLFKRSCKIVFSTLW